MGHRLEGFWNEDHRTPDERWVVQGVGWTLGCSTSGFSGSRPVSARSVDQLHPFVASPGARPRRTAVRLVQASVGSTEPYYDSRP